MSTDVNTAETVGMTPPKGPKGLLNLPVELIEMIYYRVDSIDDTYSFTRCCKDVHAMTTDLLRQDTARIKEHWPHFYIATGAEGLAQAVRSGRISNPRFEQALSGGMKGLLGLIRQEVPSSGVLLRAMNRAHTAIIAPLGEKLHLVSSEIGDQRKLPTRVQVVEPSNRIRVLLNFIIYCYLFKPTVSPDEKVLNHRTNLNLFNLHLRDIFFLACIGRNRALHYTPRTATR